MAENLEAITGQDVQLVSPRKLTDMSSVETALFKPDKITVASVTPKDDEGKKFANANFLFVPRACPGSSNLGLGKRRGDPSPKVQK